MRKSWLLICLCVFLVFVASVVFAADNAAGSSPNTDSSFARAGEYYKSGEYGKAAEEYEKVLASGYESGAIYYNLGGSYLKKGELGKAVLNYERAMYFIPRDADLATNYRFAQGAVQGRVQSGKSLWNLRPLRIYETGFTVSELAWISSAAYLVLLFVLFVGVVRPKLVPYGYFVVFLLAAFVVFNSVVLWHKVNYLNRRGIVMVKEADALYGPFDSATKFFTVQEGMGVEVLKEEDGWYKARRADGTLGWVKAESVQKLFKK